MSSSNFYRAFEEHCYAPREVIKSLRRQYLPFIEPLAVLFPKGCTFDIGCGRGEWLELMQSINLTPRGVDLDEGMLSDCFALGLPAEQGEAVAFLEKLDDESQVVVSAFHVVEHITFDQLQTTVREALRVLKPGGLLIMETPNPENIIVASSNFYLDPTHQRPIPPKLLAFLPEYHGYERVKILRLQESQELAESKNITLLNVLEGVSPDYAIIAQKKADFELPKLLDDVFKKEYGLTLDQLATRYHQQSVVALEEARQEYQKVEVMLQDSYDQCLSLNTELKDSQHQCQQLESMINTLSKSRSMRITGPLRAVGKLIRIARSRTQKLLKSFVASGRT